MLLPAPGRHHALISPEEETIGQTECDNSFSCPNQCQLVTKAKCQEPSGPNEHLYVTNPAESIQWLLEKKIGVATKSILKSLQPSIEYI